MIELTVRTRGIRNPLARILCLIFALLLTLAVAGAAVALLLMVLGFALGLATIAIGTVGIALLAAIPLIWLKRFLLRGRKSASVTLLRPAFRHRLPPSSR